MNKTQFNELLASVKQMDKVIIGANNESKTDWERLSKMTEKEIDTDVIAELSDDFFRDAQFKIPSDRKP